MLLGQRVGKSVLLSSGVDRANFLSTMAEARSESGGGEIQGRRSRESLVGAVIESAAVPADQ